MLFCIILAVYYCLVFFGNKHISDNGKRIAVLLYFFPLFILTAFRANEIGPDTYSYYMNFYKIGLFESIGDALDYSRMEPGYVLVSYLFSRINISYYVFQFFVSLFIYYSFGTFIYRYSINIPLSCFVFVANNYFFGIMNVVRMWIAISILLFSVKYILERRFGFFLIIVLFATLFHFSALLFIFLYPLSALKFSVDRIALLFFASLIIFLAAIPFFVFITNLIGLYGNYITSDRFDVSDNIAIVLTLAINVCFFAFVTYERIRNDNTKATILGPIWAEKVTIENISYAAMIVTVCISIIGLSNNIMGRISHYYDVFLLLSIAQALSKEALKNRRIIITAIICSLMYAEFAIVLFLRPDWYQVNPYSFFK